MPRVFYDDLAGLVDPALSCMGWEKCRIPAPRRKSPTGKIKTEGGPNGGIKGTREKNKNNTIIIITNTENNNNPSNENNSKVNNLNIINWS
jgi:hypothetical protein